MAIPNIFRQFPNNLAKLPSITRSKTVRQTAILYLSKVISLPLGVITSVIVTRALGPENYGILAFYGTVTGFSLLFFRFGFASTTQLLVAQAQSEQEEQKLIGASIVIFALIGLSYSLFILGFSFIIDSLFSTNVGYIFRWVAFPLILEPFAFMIGSVVQGTNRIGLLSGYYFISTILYVVGLLILLVFSKLNLISLIALGLSIAIATRLFILAILKYSYANLRLHLEKLWSKNKTYGIHLYFGQIADQSTYKLDGLFISYLVNTTQLGFYGLANTMTSPIAMLSQSLSASLFKDFTHQDRIPRRVIYFNFLWLVSCIIGVMLMGKSVVVILFPDYLPVVRLLIPLAFAGFFQGAYQPYNTFLEAVGKGKWLRDISIIVSIVNVGGNVVLVPVWGAMGAAMASVLGKLAEFVCNIFYYRQYID